MEKSAADCLIYKRNQEREERAAKKRRKLKKLLRIEEKKRKAKCEKADRKRLKEVKRETLSAHQQKAKHNMKIQGKIAKYSSMLKTESVKKKWSVFDGKPFVSEQQGKIIKKKDVWFDGDDAVIDTLRKQVDSNKQSKSSPGSGASLVKSNAKAGLSKVLGMDCKLVGGGEGGLNDIVARVTIVNHDGILLLDRYVKPGETVTNYRTATTGITASDLYSATACDYKDIIREVGAIIEGRTIVGHSLLPALKLMFIHHPYQKIRDLVEYRYFRKVTHGQRPTLHRLADLLLGLKVKSDEIDGVQDAQTAMRLYTMHRKDWESEMKKRRFGKKKKKL